MFLYCKKCANIQNCKSKKSLCEACNVAMSEVPEEFLTESKFMFISQEKRKEFEALIKTGDEFCEDAFLEREAIIRAKRIEKEKIIAEKVSAYNENTVKSACPICHCTSLEKISNVGKFVKVGVFGILGAGDIGKKYRCKSCGYKF